MSRSQEKQIRNDWNEHRKEDRNKVESGSGSKGKNVKVKRETDDERQTQDGNKGGTWIWWDGIQLG